MCADLGVVLARSLAELPRIPWSDDFADDPVPHLVAGYLEHGPVFGLDVPGADPGMVFLIGPEANRLVLSRPEQFWWGPVYAPVRKVWGPTLISMDGAEHDYWRRLMKPTVVGPALERHLLVMRDVIRAHLDEWEQAGTVDVYRGMLDITFEIAARTFCGIHDRGLMREFRELYERLIGESQNPFTGNWPNFDLSAADELRAIIRPIVARAKDEPGDDALHLLAHAVETDQEEVDFPVDDERVVAQIFLLLLAGHETTTSLSSWTLWRIAHHPDVATRLREEVEELGDDASVQMLRSSDLLQRVLMECERLYPPLPIVGRAVMEDVEFGDFAIPSGVFIQLSPGATHRLPDVFADPERFDPERFSEPRAEHRKRPFSLIGFISGPRVCLGITFAKVEMSEVVVQVLRRFDLETVASTPPPQALRATARAAEPLELRLTRRAAVPA